MKEFTDEQIIKALEYCSTDVRENTCPKCAFYKKHRCSTLMLNAVSDLINCQKAEIEELKQIIDEEDKEILKLQKRIIFWREDLNYQPEKIKSEAIKDFAERLKIKVKMYNSEDVDEGDLIDDLLTEGETVEIIDKLVKEMTEEEK